MRIVSKSVSSAGRRTAAPLGVDVGQHTLVAIASADDAPDDVVTVSGEGFKRTLEELRSVCHNFKSMYGDAHEPLQAAAVAAYWPELRGMMHNAACEIVRLARKRDVPIVALESIRPSSHTLWESRLDESRLAMWATETTVRVIEQHLLDAGIPLAHVSPDGTSSLCHECAQQGERPKTDHTRFRCLSEECHVDELDADVNAGLNIAARVTVPE